LPTTCAAASTATGTGGWSTRNTNVLLPVDRERNRRSELIGMKIQFQELLARVGAERQEPVIHAGEHHIAGRR
jgi:hypothetical protein